MDAGLEIDFKPTEDEKKLVEAVKNVFPNAKLSREKDRLVGETDLGVFMELLRKEKVRKTVRELLVKNKEGKSSHLDISKMACVAGKVGFDEGFPLGKVRLVIKDADELIKAIE